MKGKFAGACDMSNHRYLQDLMGRNKTIIFQVVISEKKNYENHTCRGLGGAELLLQGGGRVRLQWETGTLYCPFNWTSHTL